MTVTIDQHAFLATDHPVHTPFARTLRVIESAPWKEEPGVHRHCSRCRAAAATLMR